MILAICAVIFVYVLLPASFASSPSVQASICGITKIGEWLLRHIVAIYGNDHSRGVFPLAVDVGNYTLRAGVACTKRIMRESHRQQPITRTRRKEKKRKIAGMWACMVIGSGTTYSGRSAAVIESRLPIAEVSMSDSFVMKFNISRHDTLAY